jgi:arylsulfatase A-like enzyme
MVPTRFVGRTHRRAWLCVALAVFAVVAAACGGDDSADAKPSRPNIVFILTDDQRWDSMDQLPMMNAQTEWARFSNMFIEDPQCCPARASILTGRHSDHTHVQTLNDGAKLDDSTTIATMLHDAGYRTALFGKYLNGYPFGARRKTPPGWDTFQANTGKITYDNTTLIENGKRKHYGANSYPTEILTQKALQFIDQTKKSRPLFLYLAYNAPHATDVGPPVPEKRDVGSCAKDSFADPPNFNALDKVREAAWMKGTRPLNADSQRRWRVQTCETLRSVDRGVNRVLDELGKTGRMDDTYVVFMSDNGYAFGEHRLSGKGDLYEESVRVPLWVRGPGVRPGEIARLTSNIDITPTLLDWARVEAPKGFLDGHSFAPDLHGDDAADPQAVLLRGCRTVAKGTTAAASGENGTCGAYATGMGLNWGLRTQRYKYIVNPGNDLQLFDLQKDPWELSNVAYKPAYKSIVDDLQATLDRMRGTG